MLLPCGMARRDDSGGALPAESFGRLRDGSAATAYTLDNGVLRARITDYGGRLVSLETAGRDGDKRDVLLGFADAGAYEAAGGAFGALLGRTANRIGGAAFPLDGRIVRLVANDSGGATLHGGPVGFDKLLWEVTEARAEPSPTLALRHVSPDGDQGFPGRLAVEATWRLDGNGLVLDLVAETS